MTNYLDKDGLKKFWDITKGKYSAIGHNHDDRYLKIGATAANADKLGGYAGSSYTRTIYIGGKQDYQNTVILLWKDGAKAESIANGLLYTTTFGAVRGQYADLRLRFSRWGDGSLYDSHFQFNAYGEGARMKLVTCTYEGEKWWAIQHTNIQATVFHFTDFGSYGISWKPIVYYNQNTKQILNQEIYDSIVDQSSRLSTFYVGDAKNALMTDIPTKLSQLSDDVVKGKYLPLTGGTITGIITAKSNVLCEGTFLKKNGANGSAILSVTNTSSVLNVPMSMSKTLKVTGNVGIGTDADAAYKLKVNGTAYFSGDATVNGNLQVAGEIHNGNFYTDVEGRIYTTSLALIYGSNIRTWDDNGKERNFNLQKAIELGVFS